MKGFVKLAAAGAACLVVAGCGGQDRSALARQTVQQYWYDVGHMKLGKSYKMLTPGNRSETTISDYSQNMMGFIRQAAGLSATVGTAKVNGDQARVPVTLHSPLTSQPRAACQHLYWQNGKWYIGDEFGALSPAKQCEG